MSFSILPRSGPRFFECALVLASLLPFLLTLTNNWLLVRSMPYEPVLQLMAIVLLLNLIHVPATIYLYTDPQIRAQAKQRPMQLIGTPLLFLLLTPVIFGLLSAFETPAYTVALLLLLLFYFHWQAWHFGMQSYGVLSFVSITSGRPRRQPWQKNLERGLVMAGTIFGMMAICREIRSASLLKRLPDIPEAQFVSAGEWLYSLGMIGSYIVAAIALMYLLRWHRLFTFNSGLIFLISTCFFLPSYLGRLLPYSAMPDSIVSLVNFSVVHGIQYLVFLLAHMVGRIRELKKKPNAPRYDHFMPLAYFIVIAVFAGMNLNDVSRISLWSGQGLNAMGYTLAPDRLFLAAFGFSFGLTMAHFWVDQFIWRLSKPGPRDWVKARFSHVLPA